MWIFNKYQSETFTYFIPSPPSRNNGYREKELDSLSALFNDYSIQFTISSTVESSNGFWTIFILKASKKNFERLKNSHRFHDYTMEDRNHEIEIISDDDDQFHNVENFQL